MCHHGVVTQQVRLFIAASLLKAPSCAQMDSKSCGYYVLGVVDAFIELATDKKGELLNLPEMLPVDLEPKVLRAHLGFG